MHKQNRYVLQKVTVGYKVDESVFEAVSDAVNIENAGDYLVDCDVEDISVEGVWDERHTGALN